MTVETVKALIAKLIDFKEQEIRELKELLHTIEITPTEIAESPDANFLAKGEKVYARILRNDKELSIFPVKSLKIRTGDPAITWLKNKIFERASTKHGFQYKFLEKDGLLEAIKIKGSISDEQLEKLLNTCRWALEKASSRK
ncbi:hypothetical protein DRO54_09225 [Candidatus Bathyarchaeota archaeon]|nr:MAG: hypothetical protein DRO54_09225 [Candidatus Bathyarchaeota archaeon]